MRSNAGKKIYYRIIFQTASALSAGSGENQYSDGDMIRDCAGNPFIPGSSLAGIYRSFFSGEDAGYYFGTAKKEDAGAQSRILVYDAKLYHAAEKEISYRSGIRDCTALDEWKTGKEGSKFDFEVVEPGAEFVTYLEQNWEPEDRDIGEELAGIWKSRQISIGRKTMRGLGSIGKTSICRRSFDLGKQADLDAWLDFDMYREEDWKEKEFKGKNVQREYSQKEIHIKFVLKQRGGISIRRYTTKVNKEKVQPDAEQLTCILGKDGKEAPFIPGTSWAGAFRHHMERLVPGCTKAYFGSCEQRSSIWFGESLIKGASPKVQTRNAVDRFTAGVVETALFTEKMWYGGETELQLKFPAHTDEKFRQAMAASLTDLHTGILSIGGLTAAGRGIFEGKKLSIDNEEIPVSEEMYGQILQKLER